MMTREACFWFFAVAILVGATLAMLAGVART
jgi:ABC-type antimicrobial peptide transport system permease subunit